MGAWTRLKPALDFIYSGETPTGANGDTSQLLEAARFLQMKDLIARLEKFEADLTTLRDLLPNYFPPQKKNRKRSLQKMSLSRPATVAPVTDKIAVKLAAFTTGQPVTIKTESPSSNGDEIQIEELGTCDEEIDTSTPPPAKIKREVPTEIEVKVSDTPVVTPKPSPISGASRRKGASQVKLYTSFRRYLKFRVTTSMNFTVFEPKF